MWLLTIVSLCLLMCNYFLHSSQCQAEIDVTDCKACTVCEFMRKWPYNSFLFITLVIRLRTSMDYKTVHNPMYGSRWAQNSQNSDIRQRQQTQQSGSSYTCWMTPAHTCHQVLLKCIRQLQQVIFIYICVSTIQWKLLWIQSNLTVTYCLEPVDCADRVRIFP